MIAEAYVSFEVAKLLDEKGFDEPCHLHYHYVKEFDRYFQTEEKIDISFKKFYYPCPTHQMALAWLRKEKRIFIRIIENSTGEVFRYEIYNHTPDNNGKCYISNTYSDSYEEAVEEALKYYLKNLFDV